MRLSHITCLGMLGAVAGLVPEPAPVTLYREKLRWNSGDDSFLKITSQDFRQGFIVPVSVVQNDGVQTRTNFVENTLWDLSCVSWHVDNQEGKHGLYELLRLPYEVAPSQVKTQPPVGATFVYSGDASGSGADNSSLPLLYAPNPRGIIQYVTETGSFITPAPLTAAPLTSSASNDIGVLREVIYLKFGGTEAYHPQFSEKLTITLGTSCFTGEIPSMRSFQIHVGVEDSYEEDHVEASEGLVYTAMAASVVAGDPFEASHFASVLSDNCKENQKLIFTLHPIGTDILESPYIGCMVFNTLLCAAAFIIHTFLALFLSWIKGRHLRSEAAFLRFPGGTIKFAMFLSQGMLLSSWLLIWTRGDTQRMALPLGIGGVFFIGIVFPVVIFLRLSGVRRFSVYEDTRVPTFLSGDKDWYPKEVPEGKDIIKEAKVYSMGQSLTTSQVRKEFKKWQMLFDDHTADMVKFICVKMMLSFVFFMIHSMNSSTIPEDYRDCGHIRIASMLVFVIYMALITYLMPFRIFVVYVVEMFVSLTKAIALAFMAAGFYDGNRDHWTFEAGAVVVNIGSIVFAIFSIIRIVATILRYKQLHADEKKEDEEDEEEGAAGEKGPDDEEE